MARCRSTISSMGKVRVTIRRSAPTIDTLENLYKTIRKIVADSEAYYSDEQIEKLMEDKRNVFLERK